LPLILSGKTLQTGILDFVPVAMQRLRRLGGNAVHFNAGNLDAVGCCVQEHTRAAGGFQHVTRHTELLHDAPHGLRHIRPGVELIERIAAATVAGILPQDGLVVIREWAAPVENGHGLRVQIAPGLFGDAGLDAEFSCKGFLDNCRPASADFWRIRQFCCGFFFGRFWRFCLDGFGGFSMLFLFLTGILELCLSGQRSIHY